MKTNLVFKRQITVGGVTKVITKIVPVDIPYINTGEGWTLSGHTDAVEIVDCVPVCSISSTESVQSQNSYNSETDEKTTVKDLPNKFNSDVCGTAKLVRSKGVIRIVARRGKSTYNQTTPNSVCISDVMKNEFFKHCREVHGNVGCFEFRVSDGRPYDLWNSRIDAEYQRQKSKIYK